MAIVIQLIQVFASRLPHLTWIAEMFLMTILRCCLLTHTILIVRVMG